MYKAAILLIFCFLVTFVLVSCAFGPATSAEDQHYVTLHVPTWAGVLLACVVLGCLASLVLWRGRRLLVGSVMSIFAMILIGAAWIVTYNAQTYVMLGWTSKTPAQARNWSVSVSSGRGTLMLWLKYTRDAYADNVAEAHPGLGFTPYWYNSTPHPEVLGEEFEIVHAPQLRSWGFQITRDRGRQLGDLYIEWLSATVPNWFVLPFLLIYPTFCLRGILRHRRATRLCREGRCPKCSYDLRAHAPGQKCPECGTIIENPPSLRV